MDFDVQNNVKRIGLRTALCSVPWHPVDLSVIASKIVCTNWHIYLSKLIFALFRRIIYDYDYLFYTFRMLVPIWVALLLQLQLLSHPFEMKQKWHCSSQSYAYIPIYIYSQWQWPSYMHTHSHTDTPEHRQNQPHDRKRKKNENSSTPESYDKLKERKKEFFPNSKWRWFFFRDICFVYFQIKSIVIRAFRLNAISDDHAKPQFRIMMRK